MRKLVFVFLALIAANVSAGTKAYWAFEAKSGLFQPKDANWVAFYHNKRTIMGGAALGFKPIRFFEFGLETNYIYDTGVGYLPLNDIQGGEVTFEELPISGYAKIRVTFSDRQWIVPYASVGVTRVTYRQTVKYQEPVVGHARGTYYRAGMQMLLDGLDHRSAQYLKEEFGIKNTFLFSEYSRSNIPKGDVELGGTSYSGGILFEF